MQEFEDLVLCSYRDEKIDIYVTASLIDGTLKISGDDVGRNVEEIWDNDDYEYWYTLDKKDTKKLLQIIKAGKSPEEAILREFGGVDGCRKFREICNTNGIKYKFFSYV